MSYKVCYKGKNFLVTCRFCDLVEFDINIIQKRIGRNRKIKSYGHHILRRFDV